MKKILLITACFSMAFAEEPTMTPPSEQQAKQEIESFLTAEAAQEVHISAPELPVSEAPASEITPMEAVQLSTDSPAVTTEALAAPVAPELTPAPSIVPQALLDPEADIAALEKEEKEVAAEVKSEGIIIDLGQVFSGSPTIYTILFFLDLQLGDRRLRLRKPEDA